MCEVWLCCIYEQTGTSQWRNSRGGGGGAGGSTHREISADLPGKESVYQNGNFLPGKSISRPEKNQENDFAPSEKYSRYAPGTNVISNI